jgi:hypothetical protein
MSTVPDAAACAGGRTSTERRSRLARGLSRQLLALRVAIRRDSLDASLAGGVEPTNGSLLAVRAAALRRAIAAMDGDEVA